MSKTNTNNKHLLSYIKKDDITHIINNSLRGTDFHTVYNTHAWSRWTALTSTGTGKLSKQLHIKTTVQRTIIRQYGAIIGILTVDGQGWHGTFYPLGKTGWVKLGRNVSYR